VAIKAAVKKEGIKEINISKTSGNPS
jgi:hypothetical protein